MKKKLLLLLLLCSSLTMMAEGVRCYSLVAWTKSGEQFSFPFEAEPRITIEGTRFVVTSTQVTMDYAASDIERFTLSYTELPPEEPDAPEEPFTPDPPAETNYHLIVWTADGNHRAFAFADQPRVTIEDGWFVVASTRTTMRYAATSVEKFTLLDGDEETGIEGGAWRVEREAWNIEREVLSMRGMSGQSVIRILTVGGSVVRQMRAADDGNVSLSIADLPRGIYVVQTPTKSFKIAKK